MDHCPVQTVLMANVLLLVLNLAFWIFVKLKKREITWEVIREENSEIIDESCVFFKGYPYEDLKCAPNPQGSCLNCPTYLPKT